MLCVLAYDYIGGPSLALKDLQFVHWESLNYITLLYRGVPNCTQTVFQMPSHECQIEGKNHFFLTTTFSLMWPSISVCHQLSFLKRLKLLMRVLFSDKMFIFIAQCARSKNTHTRLRHCLFQSCANLGTRWFSTKLAWLQTFPIDFYTVLHSHYHISSSH